jgi:chloramphenicol 3-O-phosphotransferase
VTDPGRTLLLAGPSGVGKSTLAHLLQERLPEPWLIFDDDHGRPGFPGHRREFVTLRWDHALRRGAVTALRGYLDEGLNATTGWYLWDAWARGVVVEVLGGYRAYVIKLWCGLELIEQRTADRARRLHVVVDEALAFVRWQYEHERWDVPYDLSLEAEDPPEVLADRVTSWLMADPDAVAIRQLAP